MFYGISTHLGGAERSLLDFLKIYIKDSSRNDFFVLLPKSEGPLIDELKSHNIPFKVLPLPDAILKLTRTQFLGGITPKLIKNFPIDYLFRLRNLIQSEGVSTIHTTGIKCHIAMCLISPFLKTQIIIHLRDMIPTPLAYFFNLFKNIKKIQWLACSQAVSNSLPLISPHVHYDGIDDGAFFPERGDFLKKHFQIPLSSPLFGIVGIVAKWKGQKEFILAAKEILQVHPECHFVIVGDQIYDTLGDNNFLTSLKTEVRDLHLEKNIHFLGFQKNTLPIYNSLDWCVHASIQPEPFGRVMVEAMLCKTPVIASGAGGALEIIQDNITGFFHKPGDVPSLSAAMKKALNLPLHQKQILIDSAYDFSKRTYILKNRYDNLKKIIEEKS